MTGISAVTSVLCYSVNLQSGSHFAHIQWWWHI